MNTKEIKDKNFKQLAKTIAYLRNQDVEKYSDINTEKQQFKEWLKKSKLPLFIGIKS